MRNTCWQSYCTWAEQGLVHSSVTQTANASRLPLSSFPGAAWEEGGEWIFSVWAAGAPSACSSPPVLDFLSSDETERKLCCSLLPLLSPRLCSCEQLHLKKYFTLFLSTCGASVEWRGERSVCPRPVELWWEALLALAGTGDADRGEGGPVWAGTAAPAAGGVSGCPPLLPQLPVGTDPCAELQLSAQLPTPGEQEDWRLHTKYTHNICVTLSLSLSYTHQLVCSLHAFTNLLYQLFTQLYRHICTTSPVKHHKLSHTMTHRRHSTLISPTPMSNLTAQSVMRLCVDTVRAFTRANSVHAAKWGIGRRTHIQ